MEDPQFCIAFNLHNIILRVATTNFAHFKLRFLYVSLSSPSPSVCAYLATSDHDEPFTTLEMSPSVSTAHVGMISTPSCCWVTLFCASFIGLSMTSSSFLSNSDLKALPDAQQFSGPFYSCAPSKSVQISHDVCHKHFFPPFLATTEPTSASSLNEASYKKASSKSFPRTALMTTQSAHSITGFKFCPINEVFSLSVGALCIPCLLSPRQLGRGMSLSPCLKQRLERRNGRPTISSCKDKLTQECGQSRSTLLCYQATLQLVPALHSFSKSTLNLLNYLLPGLYNRPSIQPGIL